MRLSVEPKCKNCGVPIYDGRPYYSNANGTGQCARLTDCHAKEPDPIEDQHGEDE